MPSSFVATLRPPEFGAKFERLGVILDAKADMTEPCDHAGICGYRILSSLFPARATGNFSPLQCGGVVTDSNNIT
jgi:hypothetical protein